MNPKESTAPWSTVRAGWIVDDKFTRDKLQTAFDIIRNQAHAMQGQWLDGSRSLSNIIDSYLA